MALKLGLRNLDQMCKRPWLRFLLFCGVIDFVFQIQNLLYFELVRPITLHRLKVGFANSDPKSIFDHC